MLLIFCVPQIRFVLKNVYDKTIEINSSFSSSSPRVDKFELKNLRDPAAAVQGYMLRGQNSFVTDYYRCY